MRPEIYQLEQTVRFADTDAAGIVYFGMFATYFDESVISALREYAISWDRHIHEHTFLLPIVESHAQFYGPLRAGEEFKVLMAVVKLSKRSFRTEHMILKEVDGHPKLIATGYISRVCVDTNNFKPIPITPTLKTALKAHLLSQAAWEEFLEQTKEIQRR